MTSHIFFCSNLDCSNETASMDTICDDCYESEFVGCPGCGYVEPNTPGTYYCYPCYRQVCCTCDGSGRLCNICADEYAEPCRGCGKRSLLWTDNAHCRECYTERYGDEFPIVVTIAPPPPKTPDELRDIIQEIEDRLRTNMTKEQADDWRWLLMNRRAELAEALRY